MAQKKDIRKRAVIYARVSTDKQDVDMQLEQLQEYAGLLDMDVVDTITDVISSRKESRPGFNTVLEMASFRRVDAVLVWKYDRLARSTVELLQTLDTFRQTGIQFISFKDNINTDSAHGKLFFTMIAGFAEFERESTRERVQARMDMLTAAERKGKIATRSGRAVGREPLTDAVLANVLALHEKGVGATEISRRCGIGRTAVYQIIKGEHPRQKRPIYTKQKQEAPA